MVLSKNGESASALLQLMKKNEVKHLESGTHLWQGLAPTNYLVLSEKSISLIQVDVSYEDVYTSWLCS
jgi:hypothetical protein